MYMYTENIYGSQHINNKKKTLKNSYLYIGVSERLLFNIKWAMFQQEQVTFQWDDDVHLVLDQHAELDF